MHTYPSGMPNVCSKRNKNFEFEFEFCSHTQTGNRASIILLQQVPRAHKVFLVISELSPSSMSFLQGRRSWEQIDMLMYTYPYTISEQFSTMHPYFLHDFPPHVRTTMTVNFDPPMWVFVLFKVHVWGTKCCNFNHLKSSEVKSHWSFTLIFHTNSLLWTADQVSPPPLPLHGMAVAMQFLGTGFVYHFESMYQYLEKLGGGTRVNYTEITWFFIFMSWRIKTDPNGHYLYAVGEHSVNQNKPQLQGMQKALKTAENR